MDLVLTVLLVQVLYVVMAFGVHSVRQARRTGSSGFVAHRERGLLAKLAGAALTTGLLLVLATTALVDDRRWSATGSVGVAVMVTGLTVTLVAQRDLGLSWRIGVDPDERTALVDRGLFAVVRNPFFTGTLLLAAGSVLATPSALGAVGLLTAIVGILTQVVRLEEPALRRSHGQTYDAYVQRTGRFLPRVRPAVPASPTLGGRTTS